MKHRPFGRTGLEVSELILGGGAVGGLLIDANDDIRRQAVHMFLDAGMTWIDTAANYGQGRSEQAIGWLMAELPAEDRPHISTKLVFDRAAGDFSGQAERALTDSLNRLRMDSVTLYRCITGSRRRRSRSRAHSPLTTCSAKAVSLTPWKRLLRAG